MTEDIKEETRPLTEKEIAELNEEIIKSEAKLPQIEFKIDYAKLMLDKGLKANFDEKIEEMTQNLKNKEAELEFEKKLISQYKEILAKGVTNALNA